MPSFKMGADFPPSWYLMVAIPVVEGDVVVKDMAKEDSESEVDKDEFGFARKGGTSEETDGRGELGGDSVLATELAKRPVRGFREGRVRGRRVARVLGDN